MRNLRLLLLILGILVVVVACALSVWWNLFFQSVFFGMLSIGGIVCLVTFPLRFEVRHDALTIIQLFGCRRFPWKRIGYISRLPGSFSLNIDERGRRSISRRTGVLIIKVGPKRIPLGVTREREHDRLALIAEAQINGVALSSSV
jgi:hypothetical protein